MIRLDLDYVENWSIGADLAILVKTVAVVLGRPGGLLRPASRLLASSRRRTLTVLASKAISIDSPPRGPSTCRSSSRASKIRSSRKPPRSLDAPGLAWAWAVIACVLLGTSGVVRAMQERRHKDEKAYKAECPIDLDKLPDHFGKEWTVPFKEREKEKEGGRRLDELTLRITGGTAHTIRTYSNEMTGVTLTVLVLYGPAEPVLPHTPQVCYPSSGFELGNSPRHADDRLLARPPG